MASDKKTAKNGIGCRGKPGPGRPKGSPNKVTRDVKAAITLVLEGNADQVNGWLRAVAEGEREYRYDDDGKPLLNEKGEHIFDWLRRPEPGKALDLWMGLAEFNLPKLARTELSGEIGVRGKLVIHE